MQTGLQKIILLCVSTKSNLLYNTHYLSQIQKRPPKSRKHIMDDLNIEEPKSEVGTKKVTMEASRAMK